MQTEAVFENIAERIEAEIKNSKSSIYIAVAGLTNKTIFDTLVKKAQDGCQVLLMVSDDLIHNKSSLEYELLNVNSSKVYRIVDGNSVLLHNKFCVIDHSTVLTGSYNWSNKAESGFENIVITYNDTRLAEQFIAEFNKIKNRYYPESEAQEKEFPLDKIIKRLEILKNYVLLEEIEELKRGTSKLKDYDFNPDIETITRLINSEDFAEAIKKIESFITENRQLHIWTDPEIAALKLEIKNLENQINAFDNEKIELEKMLSDFHHRHTVELGEIVLEILRLRKLLYKDNEEKYAEAEKDEKEYRGQFEEEKERELFELNDEQKKELKKSFRKASTMCHPDKFSNEPAEVQKQAEFIFKELNEANAKNDLKKVAEILENLEKGILKTSKGDSISDKFILRATIKKLKLRLNQLEEEIRNIKQSETYQKIMSIDDWDQYFEETREKLEQELEYLKTEVNQSSL